MVDITTDLALDLTALGGLASCFTEFLRGLILKIENWPRLAASWKFLPIFLGAGAVLLFPDIVPGASALQRLGLGASSPGAFYVLFPIIKKVYASRAKALLGGSNPEAPPALPNKEGTQ